MGCGVEKMNRWKGGGGVNQTDLSQRKITLPISGGFEDHMRTKRYQLIAVNNRYEVSPLYSYMETESSGTWMTKTSTLCPTKRGVRTMSIDRSRQEEKVTRPGGWATTLKANSISHFLPLLYGIFPRDWKINILLILQITGIMFQMIIKSSLFVEKCLVKLSFRL